MDGSGKSPEPLVAAAASARNARRSRYFEGSHGQHRQAARAAKAHEGMRGRRSIRSRYWRMTPSDDLEEALRQNLKLRSELAAEVTGAKAESHREEVAYRLGRFLSWACLELASNIAKLPELLG